MHEELKAVNNNDTNDDLTTELCVITIELLEARNNMLCAQYASINEKQEVKRKIVLCMKEVEIQC